MFWLSGGVNTGPDAVESVPRWKDAKQGEKEEGAQWGAVGLGSPRLCSPVSLTFAWLPSGMSGVSKECESCFLLCCFP